LQCSSSFVVPFTVFVIRVCLKGRTPINFNSYFESRLQCFIFCTFLMGIPSSISNIGPSWSWSVYLQLPMQSVHITLTLWFRIPLRRSALNTILCDRVCLWLAAGRWFSPGIPISVKHNSPSPISNRFNLVMTFDW
jgi:hypothetical protein